MLEQKINLIHDVNIIYKFVTRKRKKIIVT